MLLINLKKSLFTPFNFLTYIEKKIELIKIF